MGYYMGDPGFLSTLGNIAKGVIGMIPGVGGIASTAIEKVTSGGLSRTPSAIGRIVGAMQAPALKVARTVIEHPALTAAGSAAAVGGVAMAMHAARGGHPAVRAALGMRRHKRMNVCNPRALRRAIRRTHGFARVAMRTIHLVHPKKKARFGGFKRHRRRAA